MPLHPVLSHLLTVAGIDISTLSSTRGPVFRTPTGAYYGKTARGRSAAQMRGEAASLAAMGATAPPGLVPPIIGYIEPDGAVARDIGEGEVGALVTEYAEGRGGDQAALGRALAMMHRPPEEQRGGVAEGKRQALGAEELAQHAEYTGKFGFAVPTHCGATEQDNTWEESWEVFFRDRRLGDLVQRIGDRRVNKAWTRCRERAVHLLLHDITPSPVPVPLHGDLWPGNVAGESIYDPAGYYGHGEVDLGMTKMFGGFSQAFYDAYHEIHPRSEPHYDQRVRLYELYHHLNHALMFGGGYTGGAIRIMEELASWADQVEGEGA